MNKNRYLADASDDRHSSYPRVFGAKEDGALYFNSAILTIASRPDTPVMERLNYLQIVYKNIMELLGRIGNSISDQKFHQLYLYAFMFIQQINQTLEQYPVNRHFYSADPDTLQTYLGNPGDPDLQLVLDLQNPEHLVGYRKSDLKGIWFDGVREIPISFHRDFNYEHILNNLDLWCEPYMHRVSQEMNARKLRLVTAWVDKSTDLNSLKDIRVRLRKMGLFPLFMNIDLLNAENSWHLWTDPALKYPTHEPEYTYVNYFTRTEPRYIRTPFESFTEVIDFYYQASINPDVKNIYIAIYRSVTNGKLIDTLIRATKNGKNLFIYIEPTARGDEQNNLDIITRLKNECDDSHLFIRCSYCGMKVHAKMGLVECEDGTMICHMGTGNLNEKTAKIYTDFHVISREEDDIIQVIEAFKALGTGVPVRQKIKDTLLKEIRTQAALGEEGRIALKCNHSVDEDLVYELKMAAQCGCSIKMITRTSLGIMPQDIGADVSSIMGQFLEHERIYCFGNEENIRVYLSSSDLMFRNLYKRMEILFQVKDSELAWQLMKEIWFD